MPQPCRSGCGGCSAKCLIRAPREIVRGEIFFASFARRQFMFSLNVNGQTVEVDAEPDTPLLWVLRDQSAWSAPSSAAASPSAAPAPCMSTAAATRSCQLPLRAPSAPRSSPSRAWAARSATPCRTAWQQLEVVAVRLLPVGPDHGGGGAAQPRPEADRRRHRRRHDGNICRCATYQRIRAGRAPRRRAAGGLSHAARSACST